MINKNYQSDQPDSDMLSPMPTNNNTSIISATRIGDISITKDNHSSPERDLHSTGTKMVKTGMEKIQEEYDENEYADINRQAQLQTSDYNEAEVFNKAQKDSMRDFTHSSFERATEPRLHKDLVN